MQNAGVRVDRNVDEIGPWENLATVPGVRSGSLVQAKRAGTVEFGTECVYRSEKAKFVCSPTPISCAPDFA